jgi:hypothetical protein
MNKQFFAYFNNRLTVMYEYHLGKLVFYGNSFSSINAKQRLTHREFYETLINYDFEYEEIKHFIFWFNTKVLPQMRLTNVQKRILKDGFYEYEFFNKKIMAFKSNSNFQEYFRVSDLQNASDGNFSQALDDAYIDFIVRKSVEGQRGKPSVYISFDGLKILQSDYKSNLKLSVFIKQIITDLTILPINSVPQTSIEDFEFVFKEHWDAPNKLTLFEEWWSNTGFPY